MNKIFLEVNGIQYEGFTDVVINRSIENFCSEFSFSTTVREDESRVIQNAFKVQDEVKIFIDSQLITTGYIEDLDISYSASADSHNISLKGRDKTGDLIDSSAIEKEYSTRSFSRLVEITLKDNGYTNIKTINNLGALAFQEDIVKVEKSDTIFSFLDKYAKKLQVLLTTNEEGNIVITREGTAKADGVLISEKLGKNNNILSASISATSREMFRFIEVYAQSNNDSFGDNSTNQKGLAIDNQIRSVRRKRMTLDLASSAITLNQLANWQLNLRRAKGRRYECTVQGFYSKDKIWKANTLVEVLDDKCQLNGEFLIQGVSYQKSNSGTFTTLSIVNKGAFTLTPVAIRQLSSNNFASGLFRSA